MKLFDKSQSKPNPFGSKEEYRRILADVPDRNYMISAYEELKPKLIILRTNQMHLMSSEEKRKYAAAFAFGLSFKYREQVSEPNSGDKL